MFVVVVSDTRSFLEPMTTTGVRNPRDVWREWLQQSGITRNTVDMTVSLATMLK